MQPPLKPKTFGTSRITTDEQASFVAILDAVMTLHIQQRQREAAELAADYGRMWSYIEATYRAGGKRLRPYLAYLMFSALSREEPAMDGFMSAAIAIEFVHMAMLMHDDIIDRDYTRHGQANIAGLYRDHYGALAPHAETDHHADGAALLSGDVLISEAYRTVMGSSLTASHRQKVSAALGQAIFEASGGELLDMEAVYHDIESTDARSIGYLKTASYTCVMPLTIGAILAGASEKTLAEIQTIGSAIGIAFQMADDELGVFGDTAVTGKPVGNDLREGKRTMLLQQTLAMATPGDRREFELLLGRADLTDTMVDRCRAIIDRSGARAAHAAERRAYTERALGGLARLPFDAGRAEGITALFERLAERAA